MIREYKIKIDDAILHGHTPTEFHQPTRADCAVMNRYGEITIGDHFMENCGPRLILAPPKPEWSVACTVEQRVTPGTFDPMGGPPPDAREALALAIREALPKLETLCDLARKALTQSPSASATLSVLEADPRKKFSYISEHGVAAYLDLKSRAAVERKAASL